MSGANGDDLDGKGTRVARFYVQKRGRATQHEFRSFEDECHSTHGRYCVCATN